MYRPLYYNRPIRHLFRGGTNAIKSTGKQDLKWKPLTSRHPTKNQGAMEPELQVLPMLVYLLLYQEQQRRRRRPQMSPAAWDGCPLVMLAMSSVVALSDHVAGLVTVVAAVSVVDMLPVVNVSAPVEGDSRNSPAASDGCSLEMMLGTVAEAADVQMAVQVAVSTAVQVAVLVARRGDSSPSAGDSVPCPDFPFALCPFPTLDVAAGPLALSPFGLEEALLSGW
ncbi:hypothetical protein NDU88_005470 [Pleurodeles waltl]|uniref:Uncharacterized protein n=1 Tax=Pleurodeles waltl TaxID=8319 RepID=A0AAV7LPL5_PLEWA|nr:hypothetical protein NDU88_005470 [Pleurodeles waltl]